MPPVDLANDGEGGDQTVEIPIEKYIHIYIYTYIYMFDKYICRNTRQMTPL